MDIVFASLQTELGHDAVHVTTAPSAAAFWWDRPPQDSLVYSRTDLNASGLRVRGSPGMAVFVRLVSDAVVQGGGFEAVARVMDLSNAPLGASTANCFDDHNDRACSGRGECAPGSEDGDLGRCICHQGFFGRTCQEKVCDMDNIASSLPVWTLVRTLEHVYYNHNFIQRLILW